jgi:hypothetical protein
MNGKAFLIYLFCILITVCGCVPRSDLSTSPSETTTPQLSGTLSMTIPNKLPTTTDSPDSGMPTPSLLSIPTLVEADALSLFHGFIKNQPPCQLPCWGGITPGKSTFLESQKLLTSLSGISDSLYFSEVADSWVVGTSFVSYPLKNTLLRVRPGFLALSTNEVIVNISIFTQSLPQNSEGLVYGDKEYNSILFAYSLPQILSTYGLPDLIYMTAEENVGEPNSADFFKIRVLYLDLAIFISYTMPMETKDTNFRFCPSESLINLELVQQSTGRNYQEFFQQVGNTEWASIPYKTRDLPIEEALRLTREEFVQLAISEQDMCFETPMDIWPEP